MVSLTEVTFDWNCFCGFCCFVIPVSIYQNLDLKGDHEKPLIPKFALRSLIFFFSSYFVNVSSEFNQVIFWSCFMQYEWDIWYLLIVTLSADVLVLVLGVVMETVNEYLIVNICCHRISYWHIFVCARCFGLFLKGRTLFAFWKINKWYVAKDKVFVQSALKSFNIELTEIQFLLHTTIIIIDRSTFSLVGSGKY